MAGKFQKFFNSWIWDTEKRYGNAVFNNSDTSYFWNTHKSKSGKIVSNDSLMTLSAVYRAVAIKAGFISSLPFQVFEKTDKGRVLSNHPVSKLLSSRPNNKLSKVVYFDRAMQHYELLGNHFALIIRNGIGKVDHYELLNPNDVEVIETQNDLIYKVKGVEGLVQSDNMIHVPNMGTGSSGKSVLSFMREDAELMMDVREYGESFFGGGGKPAALLIPKQNATLTQRQEMKQSFRAAKEQGGEVAMPFGWDYKEISIPPKDADWITTNDFAISTVARWFGVPTQKLGDSQVKYSNVEFMGIEFLQDTMGPITAKFENEYTYKSFQLSSEANLYAEINIDAYLRADSMTKAEAIAKRIQNAQLTPNEGRALDNRPALDGGDELMIQGATVPLSLQRDMMATKQPIPRKSSLRKKIEEDVRKGMDSQMIIEGILGNDGKGY